MKTAEELQIKVCGGRN